MEQIPKEQLKENILEMARFLHEEAVFAYSAYDMLQKLFECEKSYQAEMALWNGPVGRAGCPRGADNFGNGCDAVLCGGIGAFFVEE